MENELKARGVPAEFVALQPDIDETRPKGGWTLVVQWLLNNSPERRVREFFGSGLFASSKPLDCILIQMDTDILGQEQFCTRIKSVLNLMPNNPDGPENRAAEISKILGAAADIDKLTASDARRHIFCPAVESTEAWCIAAFSNISGKFPALSGQALVNEFMMALEKSEGVTVKAAYAEINKDVQRRKRFCERHAGGSARVSASCSVFRSSINELDALAAT